MSTAAPTNKYNLTSTDLTAPWKIAEIDIPNRVALAPLAGIGNWFVRLQAKRYGAGLAISEMVSSFAIHYQNEKTCKELLTIHPDERGSGPIAIQLFGHDPKVMRSAAKTVAAIEPDFIDINMGCPVPKVCKTGAGAALLSDHDTAIAVAKAARQGSGLPVTVKLRAGQKPEDRGGVELAHRLVNEAGVAAISFHPRSAMVRHKGTPDYELAAQLIEHLDAPVILSGGMNDADEIREVAAQTGTAAIMLARGSFGNPWLFQQTLGIRTDCPTRSEIFRELDWIIDRAIEHFGEDRASRYLRKFYPWYLERIQATKQQQTGVQLAEGLEAQRVLIAEIERG